MDVARVRSGLRINRPARADCLRHAASRVLNGSARGQTRTEVNASVRQKKCVSMHTGGPDKRSTRSRSRGSCLVWIPRCCGSTRTQACCTRLEPRVTPAATAVETSHGSSESPHSLPLASTLPGGNDLPPRRRELSRPRRRGLPRATEPHRACSLHLSGSSLLGFGELTPQLTELLIGGRFAERGKNLFFLLLHVMSDFADHGRDESVNSRCLWVTG
jgi:hypothetical protein